MQHEMCVTLVAQQLCSLVAQRHELLEHLGVRVTASAVERKLKLSARLGHGARVENCKRVLPRHQDLHGRDSLIFVVRD
jgi:hypothetical protein